VSNIGRVMTLVVKIDSDDESKWIWQNHLNRKATLPDLGFRVEAIADEDALALLDVYREKFGEPEDWEESK
jgi:hypothetical protein